MTAITPRQRQYLADMISRICTSADDEGTRIHFQDRAAEELHGTATWTAILAARKALRAAKNNGADTDEIARLSEARNAAFEAHESAKTAWIEARFARNAEIEQINLDTLTKAEASALIDEMTAR